MAISAQVAAGSANGTTPPAPTLDAYQSDERGVINFGSGASPAAGAQVVVTLGAGWSGYTSMPAVLYIPVPMNTATAALGPWVATLDATGRLLTFTSTVAPAASQAATTYKLGYACFA